MTAESEGKKDSNIWTDQLRVDPEILHHQDEWSDLYSQTMKNLIESDHQLQNKDPDFDDSSEMSQLHGWISYEDRKILQNIWMKAAIHGKSIFYPSNSMQLWYYWLYESSLYLDCIDASVVAIIVLSLLESKQCLTIGNSSTLDSLSFTVSSLIFINALLQFFDLFLFVQSNHWSRGRRKIRNHLQQDSTLSWQLLRAMSVLLIAINCIIRFRFPTIPNVSQILIPFLVIPRREDLKQLAKGIFSAILQLRNIFQFWILFIILWAFFGFCLLRRYDDGDGSGSAGDDANNYSTGRFSTYLKSLYVCLHCVLSRPTVLYRLKPIFSQNNFIAFYFVFLTIFGDILISALVIAMGTRAFRQFSRQNLNGRLCYRHHALLALYSLYSENTPINTFDTHTIGDQTQNPRLNHSHSEEQKKNNSEGGGMTFIQWYNFCIELPHDLRFQNEKDIQIIFFTEDKTNSGVIREMQFIRLCAVVTRKLIFFTSALHTNPSIINTIEQTRSASFKNENVVRRYLQDVAIQNLNSNLENSILLKSLGELSRFDRPNVAEISRDSSISSTSSTVPFPNNQNNQIERNNTAPFPRTATMNTAASFEGMLSDNHFRKTRSSDIYYFRDSISSFFTQNQQVGPAYKWLRRKILRFYYYHFIIKNPFFRASNRSLSDTMMEPSNENTMNKAAETASEERVNRSQTTSSNGSMWSSPIWRISALLAFQTFLNLVLIVQTSALSAQDKSIAAVAIGWFLFFLYLFESIVFTIVFKRTKFELRIMWILNLIQFILYCLLGSDVNHFNETILTLIIILQSVRFIQCISNFTIFRSFLKIMPVLQQTIVFYAIILYSFAWIGHLTLCGLLDAADVTNNDDDSHGWLTFAELLNFNTIFSSCYTIAISAILSNWSMIMDAALESNNQSLVTNWIYFYFFSYRFIAVLILLPLLMSCVIQTYMQYFTRTSSSFSTGAKKGNDSHPAPVAGSEVRGVRKSYANKLSLDFFHCTIKYKQTDAIAALWSTDGTAKVAVVKSVYSGKYGIVIEDLFSQEVVDSLDHQISNTKELLFRYYQKDIKHYYKNIAMDKLVGQFHYDSAKDQNDATLNPLQTKPLERAKTSDNPTLSTSSSFPSMDYRKHLYNNPDVMLFQLTNAMLLRKQIKWEKEYHEFEKNCEFRNYRFINRSFLKECKEHFSSEETGDLAAVWFEDAIQGITLIYPTSAFALWCLRWLHSHQFTRILYLFSLAQMLAVFLIIPQCFVSGETPNDAGTAIISLRALGIFDTCCVLVYAVDIFLDYVACWNTYRSYSWLELNGKVWLFLRSIVVGFILLKGIFSIVNTNSLFNNLRVVRIFFPILVIARSSNFAAIFYGIGLSMNETKSVYILFGFFLFIFTFSGFWLFQRFATYAGRFADLFHSILTILQCSTSAPFSLYVLMPYFDISQISPIFFLLLSYATETLCINLIIGTGNVFFNRYGEYILQSSIEKQFNSFIAIFFLLCDPHLETINFRQFLCFCRNLPSKYFAISYHEDEKRFEEILFSLLLYVKKDVLLMNGLLDQRAEKEKPQGETNEVGTHDTSSATKLHGIYLQWKINREEFIQLLFMIFNGVTCEMAAQQQRIGLIHINKLFSRQQNSKQESPSPTRFENASRWKRFTDLFRDRRKEESQKSEQHHPSDELTGAIEMAPMASDFHEAIPKDVDKKQETIHSPPLQEEEGKLKTSVPSFSSAAALRTSEQHRLLKNEIPLSICEISIKNEQTSLFTVEFFQHFLLCGWFTIHREYFRVVISFCQYLTFQQAIVAKSQPISILDILSFVFHFLLLIQLIYFSSITLSNPSWLFFGYFLECMFWLEMFIRMIAFGELRFFSDSVQVIRAFINFLSVLFMILMGHSYIDTTNGYYLLVITLQCFRLFLFCTRIRGNGRYRLAIKNAWRAMSLLMLILYFWTIIAQEIFCGVLSNDTVTGSPTNDDDATSWNQFADILNFNNYQQTLFTLFEVTVLGSWSMVMDAAARQSPVSTIPLIFFFTFRLLMTFVILPMLMSFMVRSFIALYDQIAFVHKHKRDMYKLYKERTTTNMKDESSEEGSIVTPLNQQQRTQSFDQHSNIRFAISVNENDEAGRKLEDRNFYNPSSQIIAHDKDERQDYEDEFESPEAVGGGSNHPASNSPKAGSSSVLLSLCFRNRFHYRPPKPNKFFSSLPFVELWDTLALKESDDNSLYNPVENQIILNLENYRLQLQYFSYLLYIKYREHRQSNSLPTTGRNEGQVNQQELSEDKDNDEQTSEMLHDLDDDRIPAAEDNQNAECDDDAVTEDEDGRFAESLFEKRIATVQEKKQKRQRAEVKKRLSSLMEEIKQLGHEEAIASSSQPITHNFPLKKPIGHEELKEYFEEVETLLQINHALNKVIHNVFIDFYKDYQQLMITCQQRKVSRNSFNARFSLFQKDDE